MAFKKEGKKFGSRPAKSFSSGPSRDRGGFGSRDDGPRGRPSFERRPASRSGGLELFDAVCERCGKDCQLPFRPTGGKPVYCRDCFSKNDAGPSRTSRPSNRGGDDLSEINRKLDRIMRALKIE